MCIASPNVRKDLSDTIKLPKNCFYIGSEIANLLKSPFYMQLKYEEYRQWLWQEIKSKNIVYQELIKIRDFILLKNNVILVCCCNNSDTCNGLVIKKALGYLLEQASPSVNTTSWQQHIKIFSVNNKFNSINYSLKKIVLNCADCGNLMELKQTRRGLYYVCNNSSYCKGNHKASKRGYPLGIPGDELTRLWRVKAHIVLARLYKGQNPLMTKTEAYGFLSYSMSLSLKQAHISKMSLSQCKEVVSLFSFD